jgi:hypothetical protein
MSQTLKIIVFKNQVPIYFSLILNYLMTISFLIKRFICILYNILFNKFKSNFAHLNIIFLFILNPINGQKSFIIINFNPFFIFF